MVKQKLRAFFDSPWPTLIKYGFCFAITGVAFYKVHSLRALGISMIEILLIFEVCNEIARKSRIAGSVLSSVLLLLVDVQLLVFMFSNSFLTLIFISNLNSIEDLMGKMAVYLSAAFIMLCFIGLPIRHIDHKYPQAMGTLGCAAGLIFLLSAAEAVSVDTLGYEYSPLFSYVRLATEHAESEQTKEEIKTQPNITGEFYRAGIEDYYPKPAELPDKPNVVLIFVEGLSQDIVDDKREIMPNVARYQSESLTFSTYFNHTFATYRGLMGQLFSGFQLDNFDTNTLVSLPHIMRRQGYQTAFINVEPGNRDFYNYLTTLGFQEVLDYPDEEHYGVVPGHFSDREAYDTLFEEMEKREESGQPFFLSIYTVGTHASFDSVDEKFGDGSDSELNKFYDADYQFGEFMERFCASPLFDDTVLVFTADHCTYGDMYYTDAFPRHRRTNMEVDAIPLFIHYKGVEPETIEVDGRTTIDMAPTLLDFLDVSAPNYFVGTSLFSSNSEASELEMFFTDGGMTELSTAGGTIRSIPAAQKESITQQLRNYYAAKQQKPMRPKATTVEGTDS